MTELGGGARQRLLESGFAYAGTRLVVQALGFVLIPIYASFLGAEGYGLLAVLSAVAGVAVLLAAQGLGPAWMRLRWDETSEEGRRALRAGILVHVSMSFAALFAVWLLIDAHVLGWLEIADARGLAQLALVAAMLGFVQQLYQVELEARAHRRRWVAYVLTFGVLGLATNVVLVAGFDLGVAGKLLADVLTGTTAVVVALFGLRPLRLGAASPTRVRRAVAYGLPLVPHSLATTLNECADRYLVASLMTLSAAGVYGLGARIGSVVQLVSLSLWRAYAPMFLQAMKAAEVGTAAGEAGDADVLRRRIVDVALMMVTACGGITVIVAAIASDAVHLLATPEFAGAIDVVRVTTLSAFVYALYAAFNQPVYYRPESARRIAWISVTGALVNIILNIVLIPIFGVLGAAYATLASNCVFAVLAFGLAQRMVPLPYPGPRLLATILIVPVGVGTLWACDELLDGWRVRAALKVGVLTACALAWLRLNRVTPRELVELCRRRLMD